MIELRLPIPPSVNAMYRNVRGRGRVKTGHYRAWLADADKWLLTQRRGLGRVSGPCTVEIFVPASMRGDCSNRIKAAEDFLVSREITGDDRHNWKVSIERDEGLTDGCLVRVRAR